MADIVQTRQAPDLDVVQPMPPLGDDQFAALRDDIATKGVLVPITVDQHGRIIDGNNRSAIAKDLGIDCPQVEVEVDDDAAALDLALTLNCARRHLSQEQKRDLIRGEIVRRPGDSDRAIARRLGASPTTVGTVRRSLDGPSNLDSAAMTAAEAETSTSDILEAVVTARAALYAVAGHALNSHIPQMEVIGALTMARLRFAKRTDHSDEAQEFYLSQVWDFVLEVTSWDETAAQWPPLVDAQASAEERAEILQRIVMMGDQDHPADLEGPA